MKRMFDIVSYLAICSLETIYLIEMLEIQNYIQKMFTTIPQQNHHQSSFLVNSIMQSPPSHLRTYSSNKIMYHITQQSSESRIPSQKKLTLTCQSNISPVLKIQREDGNLLKKKHFDNINQKQKFVSLKNSYVNDSESQMGTQKNVKMDYSEIVAEFQQKLEILKGIYAKNLREYSSKIEELESCLMRNKNQLAVKHKQIEKLESAILDLQNKPIQTKQRQRSILENKIQDLQKKLRIINYHHEQTQEENNKKYDKITNQVIKHFGSKLSSLRDKNSDFIRKSLIYLISIEQKLVAKMRAKQDKEKQEQSVDTRGSMNSVGDISFANHIQEEGQSFWDDCFFYPSERSENCELLKEMASRRGQALTCWQDTSGFLHYCDSGSYLYNRKGQRVKLCTDELNQLQSQNLLKIY